MPTFGNATSRGLQLSVLRPPVWQTPTWMSIIPTLSPSPWQPEKPGIIILILNVRKLRCATLKWLLVRCGQHTYETGVWLHFCLTPKPGSWPLGWVNTMAKLITMQSMMSHSSVHLPGSSGVNAHPWVRWWLSFLEKVRPPTSFCSSAPSWNAPSHQHGTHSQARFHSH